MDKIKKQSSKVGELIFSIETGTVYRRALTLTWDILRETGILLWLILCLVFVGAEGFWHASIHLGTNARKWYEGLKEPKPEEEPKSASEIGQSMMTALGASTANLLYQAKKQLDIDAEPPAPKSAPAPKVAPEATVPDVLAHQSPPAATATETTDEASEPTTKSEEE